MAKHNGDDWFEKFGQAFREVVVPVLEEMNVRLQDLGEDVSQIERRLGRIEDRFWKHHKQIGNHERRITKLETKRPAVA